MLATVAACTVLLLLAQQLGLLEKMHEVCADIVACPTCSVMWGTFALLVLRDYPVIESFAAAFAAAYVSRWLQLLTVLLARLYNSLWERVRKPRSARSRSASR